eukprot:467355-Pyramimonas_sp.AAC.1
MRTPGGLPGPPAEPLGPAELREPPLLLEGCQKSLEGHQQRFKGHQLNYRCHPPIHEDHHQHFQGHLLS